MKDLILGFFLAAIGIAIAVGLFLLTSFPIKWAWNYVMPYLFDFKEIAWGHAFCLQLLGYALIKSTVSSRKKEED